MIHFNIIPKVFSPGKLPLQRYSEIMAGHDGYLSPSTRQKSENQAFISCPLAYSKDQNRAPNCTCATQVRRSVRI